MSEKILVPVLGESITEATVSKWLKKQGDSVIIDEAVVELETDKVNLEVPASTHGVISEINAKEGDTVEVGAVLGVISDSVKESPEISAITSPSETLSPDLTSIDRTSPVTIDETSIAAFSVSKVIIGSFSLID